jgi:hypothetical protein
LAELFVASQLVRLGYVPELEAALGDGLVDAAIRVDERTIYFEVISPERSATMNEALADIQAHAARLRGENAGKKIEVLLAVDLTATVAEAVSQFLRSAKTSPTVQEIAGVGSAIVEPADGTLIVSPRIQSTGDTTVFGASSGFSSDGSLVSVRMPVADHRIQRLIAGELHHFTPETVNVLVVDLSRAAGSIRGWTPLIERRFQPAQNRRLSGALMYQLNQTHPSLKHRWRALMNPYAYQSVPGAFVTAIESLNE